MRFPARLRTLFLIALFAAGMVVQTTSATFMGVAMAVTATAGMDMPDCDGCNADNEGSDSCGFACVPLNAATVDADAIFQSMAEARADGDRSKGLRGRVGPPEPDPPQATILS